MTFVKRDPQTGDYLLNHAPAERDSLLTSADVRLIVESNGCSYPGCAGNWDGTANALNALLRSKLAAAIAEARLDEFTLVREMQIVLGAPGKAYGEWAGEHVAVLEQARK